MDKVPKMISTKDLFYIGDAFAMNYTACKKANLYARSVTDEEIKKELESVSKMHQKVCDGVTKLLK